MPDTVKRAEYQASVATSDLVHRPKQLSPIARQMLDALAGLTLREALDAANEVHGAIAEQWNELPKGVKLKPPA